MIGKEGIIKHWKKFILDLEREHARLAEGITGVY